MDTVDKDSGWQVSSKLCQQLQEGGTLPHVPLIRCVLWWSGQIQEANGRLVTTISDDLIRSGNDKNRNDKLNKCIQNYSD